MRPPPRSAPRDVPASAVLAKAGKLAITAWQLLRVAWHFVRQVSGDDAYERYLDHMVQAHPGEHAMRRGEYYRFRTEQKWNRITRCC